MALMRRKRRKTGRSLNNHSAAGRREPPPGLLQSCPVSAQLAWGEPAREILMFAHRIGCDLIAMSTHGPRLIGDLIFGSVAEAVRHRTCIPVLLIRAPRKSCTTHFAANSAEARLRLIARITVLNPNESKPCSRTIRRMRREVSWTSETWHVMPMTKEK